MQNSLTTPTIVLPAFSIRQLLYCGGGMYLAEISVELKVNDRIIISLPKSKKC